MVRDRFSHHVYSHFRFQNSKGWSCPGLTESAARLPWVSDKESMSEATKLRLHAEWTDTAVELNIERLAETAAGIRLSFNLIKKD